MPWFRVDDAFAMSPKAVAAGNAAVGLWVRAGSWSMQQLTDGHVPDPIALMLGRRQDANRLVSADLWDRVEDGYQFRNWAEYQPSKEQIETQRANAAERQRKAREKGAATNASRRDSRVTHTGSHALPNPTQPNPLKNAASASTSPPQDDEETPPPPEPDNHDQPPGPVAVLAAKMARHSVFLRLRWDSIPADKADRLVACITQLGDDAMVSAALKAVRPTDPPTFGTAFLGTWEALATARETGRHLRVIERTDPADVPAPAPAEVRKAAAGAARDQIRTTTQEGQ